MKRSRRIQLVLLGGLSAGAMAGCGPTSDAPRVGDADAVCTNNLYIPGAGYYHAPFRAWYPRPYNYFDPNTRLYYYGGQWAPTPHQSITNISPPTAQQLARATAALTPIRRGGFGSSSRSHFVGT